MESSSSFSCHMRQVASLAACVLTVGLATSAAVAETIRFAGSGVLGRFTGSMTYTPNTGVDASGNPVPDLYLTLTNTSPLVNGGFLTGVLFNIADIKPDPNLDVRVSLYPNPTALLPDDGREADLFWDVNAPEDASPYGDYEAGAALAKVKKGTDGIFIGPGDPNRGLAVGQTTTLAFDVAATNAQLLNSLNVWSFFSEGPSGGSGGPVLTARFLGFNDGGSDKTGEVHEVPGSDTQVPVVPLPPATAGALPLLGLLIARRCRRRD